MSHLISGVRAHKSELGLSVFVADEWQNRHPAMLASSPVIDGVFRIEQLVEWTQALDTAIEMLESEHYGGKSVEVLEDAANSLSYLLGKLDHLVQESRKQHEQIVERMAEEQPNLMQDYLSAFAAAVGRGDL
jgi:hypothetical protein